MRDTAKIRLNVARLKGPKLMKKKNNRGHKTFLWKYFVFVDFSIIQYYTNVSTLKLISYCEHIEYVCTPIYIMIDWCERGVYHDARETITACLCRFLVYYYTYFIIYNTVECGFKNVYTFHTREYAVYIINEFLNLTTKYTFCWNRSIIMNLHYYELYCSPSTL